MKRSAHLAAAAFIAATVPAGPTAAGSALDVSYDKARTDRWRCRFCPFESASRREGHWTVGALSVEDAEPRFGRDNGLDEDGTRMDLHATYRQRDADGRSVAVQGDHLGLDARDVVLEYGDASRGVGFRWREIPRNVSTDGRTPYAGRTLLSLPEHWTHAFDTAGMTALSEALAFDHQTQRRRMSAAARMRPHRQWRIEADYVRETRRGTVENHADFLYQAAGLPKPIDHRTEELGGKVRFEAGDFLLGADLRASRFENGDRALEWENAYGVVPATGRKGLAPGNDARSLSLVSRWAQGRTTLRSALTWGRQRQDAPFLPYTTNPLVRVDALPTDSLHGTANTRAGSFAVVSHPTDRLRVSLKHRRRERDNDTRTLLLTPVLGDLFAAEPRQARPFGFARASTELRLQYRISRRVRLGVGSNASRVRRAPAEIARNDNRTNWIELLASNPSGFRAALRFSEGRRGASTFQDETVNNPGMRRFHQAEREQRTWSITCDYRFPSTGLSVGVDADHRRADYPDSALGLQHDEDRGWNADVTYAPSARLALSAFRSVREAGASTAGSNAFGVADWWYGTQDTVDTDGLSVELRDLTRPGLSLSLTYTRSSGRGRYGTALATGASRFPDLLSEHRAVDIRARYPLRRRTVMLVRYYLEDYRAADWAVDATGLTPARNLISFGRGMPDYGTGLVLPSSHKKGWTMGLSSCTPAPPWPSPRSAARCATRRHVCGSSLFCRRSGSTAGGPLPAGSAGSSPSSTRAAVCSLRAA